MNCNIILSWAAKNGQLEAAKKTLNHGAAVRAHKCEAVRHVGVNGHTEIVKLLQAYCTD